MELNKLTIGKLRNLLDTGEISAGDIMRDIISGIEETEDNLHAYVKIDKKQLLENADKDGRKGVLSGIPVSIKDNICIKGRVSTCASNILKGFISPYNATVIKKLLENGAILIPRTNMDEFAMGSSTENSFYGVTKNPYNSNRVAGGSSGGSCAAVAGNEAIAALGSDTGGSIRQPSAFCGVVGLKPTYGRVSRYGLIAFASSLDQIGPITKDVTDCATLLGVISGYDAMDSTSANISVPDYAAGLKKGIKGIRIGVPKEYFVDGMDKEVRNAVEDAIKSMERAGADVKEISLPHTEYAVSVYYIIATAEASSNLARFDGVEYGYRAENSKEPGALLDMYELTRAQGFGPEVKRRIMLGTYVLSAGYYDAYYLKAQKVRALIKNDFQEAFKDIDVIATPTSPTPAFKIGEKSGDPLQMYLSDIYTISVNLAGLPAISVPCGFTNGGLPVGLQLIGRPFDEQTILNTAYVWEQSRI